MNFTFISNRLVLVSFCCFLLLHVHAQPDTSKAKQTVVINDVYTSMRKGQYVDSTNKPVYIIDGKEAPDSVRHQLNPNDIKSIDVLKGEKAMIRYGEKGRNGVLVITTKQAATDTAAARVETGASFPGGINNWRRYLERNLYYPKTALANKTEGTVRVQMTVSEKGTIQQAKALNDPGDGLAEEAVRVIKNGPNWIPAMQYGKPVTYQFVQNITFRTSSGLSTRLVLNRYNQTVIIKTQKFYKGQPVLSLITTEDLLGVNVVAPDMRSYFVNRIEAMQQFGLLITDKGFVAPEGDKVLYYDNNGVATDNYNNLKFVGGTRNFIIRSLFKKGTHLLDPDKLPVLVLNGKEVSAAEVQQVGFNAFRGCNLLMVPEEPAVAQYGAKGKNGILMLSTKLPYPDNYLYLLDGQESTNEEIARVPHGMIDSMTISMGRQAVEKYGDKAKYGVVRCLTRKKDFSDTVYARATQPATFPGEEEGWKKYVAANLRYPETAKKHNIEGEVRVRIVIGPDGTIRRATPANDPGNGLAEEAVRLLKEGPKWNPASLNGQPVAFTLVVPVRFKLDAASYF